MRGGGMQHWLLLCQLTVVATPSLHISYICEFLLKKKWQISNFKFINIFTFLFLAKRNLKQSQSKG